MEIRDVWDVRPGDVVTLRLTEEMQAMNPRYTGVDFVRTVESVLPYSQGTGGWRMTDGGDYFIGGYEPWVFVSAERAS